MGAHAGDTLERVAKWAEARSDIAALVQIGSRVQARNAADGWSDFDFHLVTRAPGAYRARGATEGLGERWAVCDQPVFGGVRKLTLILPEAIEVDFVVLPLFPVRCAFAALRLPRLSRFWPASLRQGVRDLRIVAGPGWQVIKGGQAWTRRYTRLGTAVPWPEFSAESLADHVAAFDAGLVWVVKKLRRGEGRAALREFHRVLLERTWILLEYEARARGLSSRPEARRAESWLEPPLLEATALVTSPDARVLAEAVLRVVDVFDAASSRLALRLGLVPPGSAALRSWARTQLADVPGTHR